MSEYFYFNEVNLNEECVYLSQIVASCRGTWAPTMAESYMSSNRTVIYVDDDEDDRDIFTEVIRAIRPDLQLVLAKDGTDALHKLETFHNPVCMYIDMNMPKMNGMQLLAALKGQPQYKTIPAFILTTALTPNQTIELKNLGASDYLIKPSSFDEFKSLLRNSLERFVR